MNYDCFQKVYLICAHINEYKNVYFTATLQALHI